MFLSLPSIWHITYCCYQSQPHDCSEVLFTICLLELSLQSLTVTDSALCFYDNACTQVQQASYHTVYISIITPKSSWAASTRTGLSNCKTSLNLCAECSTTLTSPCYSTFFNIFAAMLHNIKKQLETHTWWGQASHAKMHIHKYILGINIYGEHMFQLFTSTRKNKTNNKL
jgi:hypothetical protein